MLIARFFKEPKAFTCIRHSSISLYWMTSAESSELVSSEWQCLPDCWPPSHSGVFLYSHARDVLPISPVSEFPVFPVYFGIQLCFSISSNNFSKESMRSKHSAFPKITLDYLIEYEIQSWIFFFNLRIFIIIIWFSVMWRSQCYSVSNSLYITCVCMCVFPWKLEEAVDYSHWCQGSEIWLCFALLKAYFYSLCQALNGIFSLQTHAL